MMALNVEADMDDISGREATLRDEAGAWEWLRSDQARVEAATLGVENSTLQSRAWHLTAARRARGSRNPLDLAIDELLGVSPVELQFQTALSGGLVSNAITVTKRGISGALRVPQTEVTAISGQMAARHVMNRLRKIAEALDLETRPQIDPCYEILAVFRNLTVIPTAVEQAAEENDSGDYASVPSGEFVQLAWPIANGDNVAGITGFYLPASDDPAMIAHVMNQPTPLAIGGKFDSGHCWLRVDIETLAFRNEGMPREIPIDVIALAPRIQRREHGLDPGLVAPSDDDGLYRHQPTFTGSAA
jgi:hypothetical protein